MMKMRNTTRHVVLLLLLVMPVFVHAQNKALPRVLIIGDSVYTQNTREMSKDLKDQAQVVYADWGDAPVCNTQTALKNLDRLLGYIDREGKPLKPEARPKWDVIHFNLGLGDLVYRAPGMKSFRVMPIHFGGVRATAPEDYTKNLAELVRRLKEKTDAKLIWASTTPIRASTPDLFMLGSEVEYNQLAAKVMAEQGVAVNDMYGFVKALIDMDKPAGNSADPFFFDRKPIHPPIVRCIRKALDLPTPEPEPDGVAKK